MHRGNLVTTDASQALVLINRIDPFLVRFSVLRLYLPNLQSAGRPKPRSRVRVWPTDPWNYSLQHGARIARPDSALGITPATDSVAAADAQGTLSFVDNAVDTTTGMVRLKAQLENHDGRLWPGQFAFISLQLSVQQNALLIPTQAVQLGQQPAVYVVQPDGQAVRRPVTLGATIGRLVVVTTGVAEGERVITDGQSRLTAGAHVRVVGVDSTAQLVVSAP